MLQQLVHDRALLLEAAQVLVEKDRVRVVEHRARAREGGPASVGAPLAREVVERAFFRGRGACDRGQSEKEAEHPNAPFHERMLIKYDSIRQVFLTTRV